MQSIAIVGAGVAGLGAAYALRDRDATVTLFERADRVGGRSATRRTDGYTYDTGANYLKDGDDRVTDLVTGPLSSGLVEVEGPVWTFDADGAVSPGRDEDERKWTYEGGIATLATRLRDAADAAVETGTPVERLRRASDEWVVETAMRGAPGVSDDGSAAFDDVVLTPPAPETAALLADAEWDHPDRERIREAAAAVPYRSILSVALHYPAPVERPYYALVNTDREHAVGWLAREECKPGHVPDGESLLIAQMAPDWSADRFGDDDDAIAADAARHAAALLDEDRLRSPDWTDVARWRRALPDAGVAADAVAAARDHDLYLAGDWVAGEARLHAALSSGLKTGERVVD
ncbi:FAD-dependent oxidoreductase [Halostella sp. JP-L12]|uniref:NAD(P)/FAD-dependent oxidoreductase n=1 Tax=Halostella TaxID=1843185 RepID=UPI000EF8465E|nr:MULTISPECIES: FAD-dependent oxidoreductase [Halostella]NHN47163.1 FAD-dependent oxidoreductase [Halostella sp. JP-L12]